MTGPPRPCFARSFSSLYTSNSPYNASGSTRNRIISLMHCLGLNSSAFESSFLPSSLLSEHPSLAFLPVDCPICDYTDLISSMQLSPRYLILTPGSAILHRAVTLLTSSICLLSNTPCGVLNTELLHPSSSLGLSTPTLGSGPRVAPLVSTTLWPHSGLSPFMPPVNRFTLTGLLSGLRPESARREGDLHPFPTHNKIFPPGEHDKAFLAGVYTWGNAGTCHPSVTHMSPIFSSSSSNVAPSLHPFAPVHQHLSSSLTLGDLSGATQKILS
ncbi:hypothetical protein C8R45DRAFT_1024002 [Mycena sanguinolenta]|nr:hypothetical protein C8R45DRAFT_1024002 [Mycena sanguinolenta]